MAEDGADQFAEVGDRELQEEGAVRGKACLLFLMPALFRDQGGDLCRKAQDYPVAGTALHDAEVFAGIVLDIRQIGGQWRRVFGWGKAADAGQCEVAQIKAGGAPGDEMPAAHIVHEVQRADGAGRGNAVVRRVVGDLQGLISKECFDGRSEDAGIDKGVFDIFHRHLAVDLLQAGAAVFAGNAGDPVDKVAEIVLEGRIGDGRGQADGKRQGEDIGLADPVAGKLVGPVRVRVAAAAAIVLQRRLQFITEKFEGTVCRASGDLEFFNEVGGVGKFSRFDPAMQPAGAHKVLFFRHRLPPSNAELFVMTIDWRLPGFMLGCNLHRCHSAWKGEAQRVPGLKERLRRFILQKAEILLKEKYSQ